MTNALSQLTDHEATIERGLKTFVDVGNALAAIRDGKLYKADHATFEDYCKVRWGWTRQHAYYLIDTSSAAVRVSEISDTAPSNAGQAMPLTKLPPAEQAEVWEEVVEEAEATGEKITAKKVEQVVAKRVKKQPTKRSVMLAEREMLRTNTCTLTFNLNDVEATAQLIAHNCDEGYLAALVDSLCSHINRKA